MDILLAIIINRKILLAYNVLKINILFLIQKHIILIKPILINWYNLYNFIANGVTNRAIYIKIKNEQNGLQQIRISQFNLEQFKIKLI